MSEEEKDSRRLNRLVECCVLVALLVLGLISPVAAHGRATESSFPPATAQAPRGQTTQDYNHRLQQLLQRDQVSNLGSETGDYQIGAEDLLQISVLEAPELSRTVRVSEDGEISLPLLGTVQAAGLTSRGLEAVLENLLRRNYMKNPQVSVFVQEMRSHPVSVFGAVAKPGVFQIRQARTLIEVLSMAQGLAADAGDTVIVMRRAGDPADLRSQESKVTTTTEAEPKATSAEPSSLDEVASRPDSIEISLKQLLDSGDPRYNVLVYPGDVVKVNRAGIVYVVGDVRKPGGFLLKTNESISVLQALALAEGPTPTAEGKHARLILPGEPRGSRTQVAINLNKILDGKAPDRELQPNDILFVPNSSRKSVWHGFATSTGGIVMAVAGASVYRW